jgi:hypothetical protein
MEINMKRFYLLILLNFFLFFSLCGNAQAKIDSSLEKFIGIQLNRFEEILNFTGETLLDSKQQRIYNAAMAAETAYFSAGEMVAGCSGVPELLGVDKYSTLLAPNSWLFGSYASSYEEKGLVYTKEINGENTLVLAFRGTSNFNEWLSDANFINKKVNIGGQSLNVHRGFWNVFNEMQKPITQLVENFITRGDVKRIIVTGHSLGGAVASIAAPYLRASYDIPVELTTFEAPRVFDRKSTTKVEEMIGSDNITRLIDPKDIVPKVGYGLWRGGCLGESQRSWNIIEGENIGETHSMERIVGNLALQGRFIVEQKIEALKIAAQHQRNDAIESLNGEGSLGKELLRLKREKQTLKSALTNLTTGEEFDKLKKNYIEVKRKHNNTRSMLEAKKNQTEENLALIRQLKPVNADDLFLIQSRFENMKKPWFTTFIKSILSSLHFDIPSEKAIPIQESESFER